MPKVRSGIGKLLNRMGIESIGKSGRGALYELLEPDVFREKFSALLGHSSNEIFDYTCTTYITYPDKNYLDRW
ncbi:hypothetical protein [Thalassotalea castellviae]|uniref:Uncharacterized protein n=1 Tax=Thalassotalea castellviae TaxID=3075612 RepID=A0ABU3A2T1_9GAMM|nr:hypothetical protein [Thalassotalea sp. W431]MDT0603418.1 hypothetical protein [Thalassotalea sp. W431]